MVLTGKKRPQNLTDIIRRPGSAETIQPGSRLKFEAEPADSLHVEQNGGRIVQRVIGKGKNEWKKKLVCG
jgi:hypothetical protein